MGDCEHDFDSNEDSNYCAKGCGEKWSIYTIKTLQSQLTRANEQIDLLNEEALSRIGITTHLETRLEKANELIGKLEIYINSIGIASTFLRFHGRPSNQLNNCIELLKNNEKQSLEEIANWRDGK